MRVTVSNVGKGRANVPVYMFLYLSDGVNALDYGCRLACLLFCENKGIP